MKSLDTNDPKFIEEFLSRSSLIQEMIKIVTWIMLVLLAFRGLLEFYGAKQSNWLEQLTTFVTTPAVTPFQNLFADTKAGEVPVFFSMLCVLFIGVLLYLSVGLVSRLSLSLKAEGKQPIISSRKAQRQV